MPSNRLFLLPDPSDADIAEEDQLAVGGLVVGIDQLYDVIVPIGELEFAKVQPDVAPDVLAFFHFGPRCAGCVDLIMSVGGVGRDGFAASAAPRQRSMTWYVGFDFVTPGDRNACLPICVIWVCRPGIDIIVLRYIICVTEIVGEGHPVRGGACPGGVNGCWRIDRDL